MDLHASLIKNVNEMTTLIMIEYDNMLELALETGDHMQIIELLNPLITAHDMYINYINANNYCKAPILRVQKLLAREFAKYRSHAILSKKLIYLDGKPADIKSELDAMIINICNLGKQYAHKTKFTVMSIPVDCLDLQAD